MRGIRKRDTAPEKAVRSFLHRAGLRFRIHKKTLPGTPDVVLPKYRTAVFVHGCFWHQHPGCRHSTTPRINEHYWHPKLARNVSRDDCVEKALRDDGWRVLVIWECEVAPERLASVVALIQGHDAGAR